MVLPSSLNYFEPLFDSGILPSNSNKPEPSKRNNNRRRLKDVPKNNRRKLTRMTMNCRSAKNKIGNIAAVIDQHKPDIIFGTESWLNSNIESFPGSEKRYYSNTSFGPGRRLRNYLDPMSASRQENKITVIWIILSTKFFHRYEPRWARCITIKAWEQRV